LNFLLSLFVAAAFVALFRKSLKKHPTAFYVAAAGISFVAGVCSFSGAPDWLQSYIIDLFRKGTLATAFFAIVMYTGALKNGSRMMKALMPMRGELSIFAAILALAHILYYGKTYFKYLFTLPGKLGTLMTIETVLSLISLCILVTLFVTSFPRIRKKMNSNSWKRLQRTAYVFYGLVYIHVMIFSISYACEGRNGYVFSALLYSLVFLVYAAMRIRKALFSRQSLLVSSVVPFATASVLFTVVCAFTLHAGTSAAVTAAAPATTVQTDLAEASAEDVQKTNDSNAVSEYDEADEFEEAATSEAAASSSQFSDPMNSTDLHESADPPTLNSSSQAIPSETQQKPEPEILPMPSEIQSEIPADKSVGATTPEPSPEESAPITKYKNGTYQGSGVGFLGTITVNVTISNDLITAITIVKHSDDAVYFDYAWAGVTNSILSSQNTNVDAVSGATFSSEGIRDAVADALTKALN
jgi:DMSO/TMAO reductase YedYZ heme-binding membrane subunit/uncharacterized protein with FMN-binding domain